jgi:hypothetical protein
VFDDDNDAVADNALAAAARVVLWRLADLI